MSLCEVVCCLGVLLVSDECVCMCMCICIYVCMMFSTVNELV